MMDHTIVTEDCGFSSSIHSSNVVRGTTHHLHHHNDDDDDQEEDHETLIRLPSQFRCNYKEILSTELEEIVDIDHGHDDTEEDHAQTLQNDVTTVLPNGMTILNYERFLSYLPMKRPKENKNHNSNTNNYNDDYGSYYDDLKHVDYSYIDYGYCQVVDHHNNNTVDDDDHHHHNNLPSPPNTTTTTNTTTHRYPLIVQQNKRIPGKGGFCWDAAFILSEYIITILRQQQLQLQLPPIPSSTLYPTTTTTTTAIRMIELGCGTGICGMYIAKHFWNYHTEVGEDVASPSPPTSTATKTKYHMTLTDMNGPIQTLIQDNLRRNFHEYTSKEMEIFSDYMKQNHYLPPLVVSTSSPIIPNRDTAMRIEAKVLDWDEHYHSKYNNTTTPATAAAAAPGTTTTDSPHLPRTTTIPATTETYDIVFGSDIVATLYDPIKLAYTIYDLCHSQSVVYISYKERLSSIHAQFQNTLTQLFQSVTIFHTSTGRIIYNTSSNTTDWSDSNSNDHHHHIDLTSSSPFSISNSPWTSRNGNPNVYIIVASHRIISDV